MTESPVLRPAGPRPGWMLRGLSAITFVSLWSAVGIARDLPFAEHRFHMALPDEAGWTPVIEQNVESPGVCIRGFRDASGTRIVSLLCGDNATGVSDLNEYVTR